MSSAPPPSRYRVVERGRRLVVIDTTSGQPAARAPGLPPATSSSRVPRWLAAPQRIAFDGRSRLVTHPLYDAKGPRALELDETATSLVEGMRTVLLGAAVAYVVAVVFVPWLLALPLLLLSPKPRAAARDATTRWLDRYDADASAG